MAIGRRATLAASAHGVTADIRGDVPFALISSAEMHGLASARPWCPALPWGMGHS